MKSFGRGRDSLLHGAGLKGSLPDYKADLSFGALALLPWACREVTGANVPAKVLGTFFGILGIHSL